MKATTAFDFGTTRESAINLSVKQLGENGHLKHDDEYRVEVFDPRNQYSEVPEGYDSMEDFQRYLEGLSSEKKFAVVVRIGPKKEKPVTADTAILEMKAMRRVSAYNQARDEFRNTGDTDKFEKAVEAALRLE